MLSLGTRLLLAIVWVVAVIGALLEIPFGLIGAVGGVGDFKRPEGLVAVFGSLTGVATFILGIALATTLLSRLGLGLRARVDRVRVEATAKSLAGIALFLIALGVILDLARGDGLLIAALALMVLNGPSLVAAVLLLVSRRLTQSTIEAEP
jgi:hypothetical protein